MLSKNSMIIANNLGDPREILYNLPSSTTGPLKDVKEEDYETYQLQECTFQPRINEMSKFINRKFYVNDDSREGSKHRCNQLHNMVDYYSQRKEQ